MNRQNIALKYNLINKYKNIYNISRKNNILNYFI